MLRRFSLCAAASLALATALACQETRSDYPEITNFLRLNDKVCTGGQPSMDDLAKMKAEGIKAVINLRMPAEFNAEEEAAKTKELGLVYVHIPFSGPDAADGDKVVEAFLKATDDKAMYPAFIHCRTANRVGSLWMIRRVLVDHWPLDKAEAEARKIGLTSDNLLAFARSYISRHTQ